MALFRKKNQTTIAELEEYYANQKTRRSATAWFMALLSLLITVAIIVGLFFAGRWLYNAAFGNDETESTTTTQDGNDVNLPNYDSNNNDEVGVKFEDGTSNNPDDLIVINNDELNQEGTANSGGTVSDEAASTSESNANRVAANNQAAGSTAGSATNTPNTGAGETTLAIMAVVAVLGYLGSRRHQLSK